MCNRLRRFAEFESRPREISRFMNSKEPTANPFREGLSSRTVPEPCSVIIFGATGDLTRRKLIPALYNLAADGNLPSSVKIIGFARRSKSDGAFRADLEEATRQFSRQPVDDAVWETFADQVFYHCSEFDDLEGYRSLSAKLDAMDKKEGTCGRRLFYMAAGPDQFPSILKNLRESGLNKAPEGGWARVILEKPFGKDLPTARELNRLAGEAFPEADTFRIDHYLGKETAQNIMVLRFANSIFEGMWNARCIDHVQILSSEPLGVEGRGGYYDKSGALRDMVQNHLLQLLCLTAMEPPTDLSANSIRDEKVKVLRSLRPIRRGGSLPVVVRGQYAEGAVHGKPVPGYRQEADIPPDSATETYVALEVNIDNWRWAGVPFFIRIGKRLPKFATEIAVHFKAVPPVLFQGISGGLDHNVLVIRIQPDEGVSLRMSAKMPGSSLRIEPVKMDFHYGTSFGKASPEAYERLLLDAMSGDATLFARCDEVEEAWRFIDEVREGWDADDAGLCFYPAGSWGPEEADALLARHGLTWRRV